ncbi:MAG TPA: TetR/AcrR family transcriptional regulator [Spirochaetia bacterium]|nr:TetR/AcrR family transcriptional regulator [Spirochaetia bacterium]
MGTRSDQKATTRRLILENAERLFSERGLLSVSTAEIAKASGVSHGTLFLHFSRREELHREVIGRAGGRIAGAVHAASSSQGDLGEVLRAHLEAIAADEALYTWLVIEAPLLGPSARAALVGIQSAVAHHFYELPQMRARNTASDPQPTDRALVFNTWIGLVHHYLVNRDLFAPGGSVIERWGESLIGHFVRLLDLKGERS